MPLQKIKALLQGKPEPSVQDLQKINAYTEQLRQLPDEELDIMHDAYPSNIHIRSEINRRKKQEKEKKLYDIPRPRR